MLDGSGSPLHGSLPVGWQEVANPRLTRRALLGGLVASPAVLYSGVASAEAEYSSSWYDLELVISENQSSVSVREIKVDVYKDFVKKAGKSTEVLSEVRCVACVWDVPAAAFGKDAFFDMGQPDARPVDAKNAYERVLYVRRVQYGLRFTWQDPDGKTPTSKGGKVNKAGYVAFRFTRLGPRWKIAYETDLWLRSSGSTEAIVSSSSVELGRFIGETEKQPDKALTNGKPTSLASRLRPAEFVEAGRVGKTLQVTFGHLVTAAAPSKSVFDVSLDRHLIWHVEALDSARLLAHEGKIRSSSLSFAWRRLKEQKSDQEDGGAGGVAAGETTARSPRDIIYFSGEATSESLSLAATDGIYRHGNAGGHHLGVRLPEGRTARLDVIVGAATFLPAQSQAVCALSLTAAVVAIRSGEAALVDRVAVNGLTIAQTTTPGANGLKRVLRTVLWGNTNGAGEPLIMLPGVPEKAASDPTGKADPNKEGQEKAFGGPGTIDSPIGPLRIDKPVLRLDLEKDKDSKEPAEATDKKDEAAAKKSGDDVCEPPKVGEEEPKAEEQDRNRLAPFFQAANGDRGGVPEASIHALADRELSSPGDSRLRRIHVDLTLLGVATALPDASFSRLAFRRTELRLAFEDGAPIQELSGGEYPRSLSTSFVWTGAPSTLAQPLAVIDLSRATLTCARDYDLMKVRLRFHDLLLHYDPNPSIRPARDDARVRVGEDGAVQDSRPILVAEFDPQHVMEEAVFLPETPQLPDIDLDVLQEKEDPEKEPIKGSRQQILDHLASITDEQARTEYRKKVQHAKKKKEDEEGPQGPFHEIADGLPGEIAKLPKDWRPPADQYVYIGPFALDPDAMGVARRLMREKGRAGVLKSLQDMLERVKAQVAGPLTKRLEDITLSGEQENFANALRNEALLESLEPLYGVFRAFWRESVTGDPSAIPGGIPQLDQNSWMQVEYLIDNNRPKTYGDIRPRYDRIVDAFLNRALGKDPLDKLMGARLSGPSRLAFRVNGEAQIGVDAREAGTMPSSGDGLAVSGAGNTRFRPIPFTFEGLTEWSRFEPAVTKRARKLFQTLPSGTLPRPGNRAVNPSDQAMMRFQGFTEAPTNGEARMAEVRAALKSERVASLEDGHDRPFPGEPLDFETAIELPSRLILSTAQDAVWYTNRRMPKEVFSPDKTLPTPVPAANEALPELENGASVAGNPLTNEYPYDLWSVRLATQGENPWVRAVSSPDLRTTALAPRRLESIPRLPGEGPPPRGPYAPWFIGLEQLESQTLTEIAAPKFAGSRLARWLMERMRVRKDLPKGDYTYFRTSLDAFDRHQLVLLTSAYGLPVIGKRLPGKDNDPEKGGGLIAESGQIEPGERFVLLDATDDQALHKPVPLDVKALSLTALGGSLLHETAFKPSAGANDIFGRKIFEGFSIDTLQQDIVLGRDIRTEVVYKGYLLPLGHKASFVKLTERMFLRVEGHGIKAILRQRMFLRMADPEKLYGAMGQPHGGRLWCAKKVRLTADKTPDILDPTFPIDGDLDKNHPVSLSGKIWLDQGPGLAFWPRTDVTDQGVFRFPVTIDGAPTELPMLFLDNIAATSAHSLKAACDYYNSLVPEADVQPGTLRPPYTRTLRLAGRKIDYAPNSKSGEAQFETEQIVVRSQGRLLSASSDSWAGQLEAEDNFVTTGVLEGASQPPFYPAMEFAKIRLGQVERMSGGRQARVEVQYDGHYVLFGFPGEEPPKGYAKPAGKDANPQEVFLVLRNMYPLDMGNSGDRSGGIARPNSNIVAISRSKGPLGGDEATWWSTAPGQSAPSDPLQYDSGKPSESKLREFVQRGVLFSLAAYFNGAVERKPTPEPPKENEEDQDPYGAMGQASEAIKQISSFFSMDAKLLGTVKLKHLMRLLGLSFDSVPVLKELQEFGTAALREADELSGDIRSRVLVPLREAVALLRREWDLFDQKVADTSSDLQKGLKELGEKSPLSLKSIYPEVDSGLGKLEKSLDDALATEDAASLIPKLAAVHAAAKELIRGLAIIASNPIERLEEAVTANLREKIASLEAILKEVQGLADSFKTFVEQFVQAAPDKAAEYVTNWIFEKLADSSNRSVADSKGASELANLMPLASLPPDLRALTKLLIVDVETTAKDFWDATSREGGIADTLILDLRKTSADALKSTLTSALAKVFRGEDPVPAIEEGLKTYCDAVKASAGEAIAQTKKALDTAATGAEVAVKDAVKQLNAILDSYADQLEKRVLGAVFDVAGQYPDELNAVVTGIDRLNVTIREGKAFAKAIEGGDSETILRASGSFAQNVLGIDIAAVKAEVDGVEQKLVTEIVTQARAVFKDNVFAIVPNNGEGAVLAKERLAVDVLSAPAYVPKTPGPLPIYSLQNSATVVASNELLAAIGRQIGELDKLIDPAASADTSLDKLKSLIENNRGKIDDAAKKAGETGLGADGLLNFIAAVRFLVQGEKLDRKDCLITDLEGLYGDIVDIVVLTRGLQNFPDPDPKTVRSLQTALGDFMRRLRQLGQSLGNRLETIVKRLSQFAKEPGNQLVLKAGGIIGGGVAVLQTFLDKNQLEGIADDVRQAITTAKAAIDKAEKEIVAQLTTVTNFALGLIGKSAFGAAGAVEQVEQALPKLAAVASSFGFDLSKEMQALTAAVVQLKKKLLSFDGSTVPANLSTLKDFVDAEVGPDGAKVKILKLFNPDDAANSYHAVEVALRNAETGVIREWRMLEERVTGAPEKLRQEAEKALLSTGAFSVVNAAYAELKKQRNDLLELAESVPVFSDAARKALLVTPVQVLARDENESLDQCKVDDATSVNPMTDCDRLAQEASVAEDVAAIDDGKLEQGHRRRVVAFLNGWSARTAAPLVILSQADDMAKDLMRGDVLDAIDFGAFRDQIEDAISSLIPTKINLSYDFNSTVDKDPGAQAIFRPLPGSPFGITLRATIDLLKQRSDFSATASLGPFEIYLIGGVVDALRLKFGGAAFTVTNNTSPRFDVVYQDFVIGRDLEFAQKLQSYLSPKDGNGVFIQPMTRTAGIEVGYGINLGTIGIGATSFFNVSLNVSAELPFGNEESLFKVSLGRRLSPFTMGVFPFVGSGYFAIFAAADGVRGFEASFEYGGGAAIGYGPFQASCRIQVGVFVRVIKSDGRKTTELYGTFFAGGSASVWIFHFATSLYVRLGTAAGGEMYGEAIYSFSFSLGIADYDYSITAYKKENALGKQASLSGGKTRFAALDADVDFITTGSTSTTAPFAPAASAILIRAADQARDWKTYATYFDTNLTKEFM
ncbi:hypothetical protein [Mesorhizobium sp. M4B.F.Ca.ET.143.01.1.1]|uniref:hypothetical protein n=4 Tax=unclassified Mesorhizobium TaxID=325217 RepID=UPI001093D3C9|nr:hypothetical protein [Mesorhizobium sp. M4B.F.Ca.ET.143.01.1.1]